MNSSNFKTKIGKTRLICKKMERTLFTLSRVSSAKMFDCIPQNNSDQYKSSVCVFPNIIKSLFSIKPVSFSSKSHHCVTTYLI